ncbi:MAG: LysM peptidoglycan-binding domain-containing protein [Methylotenera sp.]|nr:LysM peptidoglycan-binding domain-containing protein [Methylotenera sp.]
MLPYIFLRATHSKIAFRSLLFSPWVWLICSLIYLPISYAETTINNVNDVEIIIDNDATQVAPKSSTTKERENTQLIRQETDLSHQQFEPDTASSTADDASYDLWQRIKNGYAMPDSTSNLVANHEKWYSTRPDYVKRMVERSQRYLFHIVEEVEKRGMPTEIALLPMIESAYNPQAYSTSRASGIWQFIPSTGKHFGLKQNWWFDNRRNITFATDAALNYLQKLYGMFGAWDLALAAYNAGEGTVGRAIERNRKLGLPTDYESLNLPPETKNYVPKLQAVKNLMTTPQNYGLNIQTIANTPYFAKVSAPKQIDAKLAAKLAEISNDEFLALNPSYNRPVITSHDGEAHELLLPITAAPTFKTNLANYNKPLVSWQTYFAKRGERMEKIATQFGIPVTQLRDVNNLPAQKKIKNAGTILVPNGHRADFDPATDSSMSSTENNETTNSNQDTNNIDIDATVAQETDTESTENTSQRNHKVKKGEGLQSIAKRYDISVKQLMATNGLKSKRVKVGQLLRIESNRNKDLPPDAHKYQSKQTYIVKRGDTLHSIADKFNVNVADIKKWNKKANNHIQHGQKLIIASE